MPEQLVDQAILLETAEFEDIDLFAEGVEERINAATNSCIASGTSLSTAGGCWCSFFCLSTACCG